MLKTSAGLLAVWASAQPALDGAVASATTFHTLPLPLPVCSAFQPLGTFPTSCLLNVNTRSFSSAAQTAAFASAMTSIPAVVHRIVQSPCHCGTETTSIGIVGKEAARGNGTQH